MGSISDYVKSMLEQLKSDQSLVGVGGSSSPNTNSPNPNTPNKGSNSSSNTNVGKGQKVKVEDLGASIYVSSDTSKSSGTWKGAGVSGSEQLYITNIANGRVALGRTNDVYKSLGWIDINKIKRFNTGGYVGDWQGTNGKLAMLDTGEFVITKKITDLLKNIPDVYNLTYSMIPKILDTFKNLGDIGKTTVNYHSEFNINNNGSELDARRMDTNIEKAIKIQLRRGGVLK